MTFRKWYLIPMILSFVMTAIWLMPLGFILNLAGAQDAGFQWTHVSGSIRSGKVTGLRLGDQQLGDLDLKWQPSRLALARLGYRAALDGPAGMMRTELTVGWGRTGLTNLSGRLELVELMSLPADFRRTGGVLSLDGISVDFHANACHEASGRARSNVLGNLVEPFGLTGSELSGQAICDGAALSIPLRGTLNQTEDVILYIRGGGGERANIDIVIDTDDAVLTSALTSRDFTPTPTGVRAYYELRIGQTHSN